MKFNLSFKIVIILLVIIIFFISIFGFIYYFIEKEKLYAQFHNEANIIIERLSYILVEPLWVVDIETINKLISFEIKHNEIYTIILKDEAEQIIYSKIKDNKFQIIDYDGSIERLNKKMIYKSISSDIIKDNSKIGTIIIYFTDYFIKQKLLYFVTLLIMQLFFLIIILIVSIFITFRFFIIIKLKKLSKYSAIISSGNLSQKITKISNDEIGELSDDFNIIIEKLGGIIKKLKYFFIENINISNKLAVNTEEVSKTVAEISTKIEQIEEKTKNFNEKIIESNQFISQIQSSIIDLNEKINFQSEFINSSSMIINESIKSINEIRNLSESKKELINILSNNSQISKNEIKKTLKSIGNIKDLSLNINKLIKSISDISEKTELLAINASIEASHAGEYGKGFVIVAKEIKNLSISVKTNTNLINKAVIQITNLIEDTEKNTRKSEKTITDTIDEAINLSETFNLIINNLNLLIISNKKIEESLKRLININNEIINSYKSITNQTTKMTEIDDIIKKISDENLSNINEIISGIVEIRKAIEDLSLLSQINADLNNNFEIELKKIET